MKKLQSGVSGGLQSLFIVLDVIYVCWNYSTEYLVL